MGKRKTPAAVVARHLELMSGEADASLGLIEFRWVWTAKSRRRLKPAGSSARRTTTG